MRSFLTRRSKPSDIETGNLGGESKEKKGRRIEFDKLKVLFDPRRAKIQGSFDSRTNEDTTVKTLKDREPKKEWLFPKDDSVGSFEKTVENATNVNKQSKPESPGSSEKKVVSPTNMNDKWVDAEKGPPPPIFNKRRTNGDTTVKTLQAREPTKEWFFPTEKKLVDGDPLSKPKTLPPDSVGSFEKTVENATNVNKQSKPESPGSSEKKAVSPTNMNDKKKGPPRHILKIRRCGGRDPLARLLLKQLAPRCNRHPPYQRSLFSQEIHSLLLPVATICGIFCQIGQQMYQKKLGQGADDPLEDTYVIIVTLYGVLGFIHFGSTPVLRLIPPTPRSRFLRHSWLLDECISLPAGLGCLAAMTSILCIPFAIGLGVCFACILSVRYYRRYMYGDEQ